MQKTLNAQYEVNNQLKKLKEVNTKEYVLYDSTFMKNKKAGRTNPHCS